MARACAGSDRDDGGHQAECQAPHDLPHGWARARREAQCARHQQQRGEERRRADVDAPAAEEARSVGDGDVCPVAEVRRRGRHQRRRGAERGEPAMSKRRADHRQQRAAQQHRPALAERPVVVARDESEDPDHEGRCGERQRQGAEGRPPRRVPELERGLARPGPETGYGERQALARQRAQPGGVNRLAGTVAHHAAVGTARPRKRERRDAGEKLADATATATAHARPLACLGRRRRAWTTRAADASRSASSTTASRPPPVIR